MAKKRLLFIAGVLLIGLLLWWSGWPRHGASSENTNAKPQEEISQSSTSGPPRSITSDASLQRGSNEITACSIAPRRLSPSEWLEQRFSHPMALYGNVVDEEGHPVQGASAEFEWVNAKGEPNFSTNLTDARGDFSIDGIKGKSLNVTVGKDGYYFSKKQNQSHFEYVDSFDPTFYRPEPNNRVRFWLHKKGANGPAEKLIVHRAILRITQDGGPVGFDPIKSKLDPNGPVIFRLTAGQTNQTGLAGVRLNIAVRDGGIQQSSEEFAFLAPVDGYKPSSDISLAVDAPREVMLRTFQWYVYVGEPRIYAKIQAEIPVYSQTASVKLPVTYWLNSSGSRNLEFDSRQLSSVATVPEYYLRPDTPAIDSLPR